MRHLGSLLLSVVGLVLLPALTAVGLVKVMAAGIGGGQPLDRTLLATGLAYLAAAGLVYTVLMVSRLSPVGLFIAGVVLAAGSLLIMLERNRVLAHLPNHLLGQTDTQWIAPAPFVFLLSIPLILSVFSTWRWRRRKQKDEVVVEQTEPLPAGAAPSEEYSSWRPA